MKKISILYTYTIIFTAIVVSGCDRYLEENPDNRVELNTVEKAGQLLTNAYSNAGYSFTEWMSDNVSYTTGTTKLPEHDQSYEWLDITGFNQDTPTNFWTTTYDAIAHANEVLAVIDELPGDKDHKDAVEAEALLTRAYGHFMLVNLFAKHYNRQTADSDPGIPYVLEPETEFIKKYTRLSVKEVYDLIEEDLLDGLKKVDETFYANSGKYHFTRNGALAFASRFYLFKQEYDNCIRYSSQMLGSDPVVFVKDITGLLETTANALDFISAWASPSDRSNLLVIRQITNYHVNVGYWPRPDLVQSLFNFNPWGTDDFRTSGQYPIFLRGSGWGIGKYDFLFERSSLTSNVGLNYTIVPVFRGEEVILNRAECYILKGMLTEAMADLQVLVSKRYDGNPTITVDVLQNIYNQGSDELNALAFVIDERRKEFFHEGLRWFDIKRFKIEVVHGLVDGTPITLTAEDNRQVLQIPKAAIDVGGLEPNPR
jgi:hypothetical protein